jgi:hypothetical protein
MEIRRSEPPASGAKVKARDGWGADNWRPMLISTRGWRGFLHHEAMIFQLVELKLRTRIFIIIELCKNHDSPAA